MKNNRKKSILLLFIIIFLVNGCSDGLFNNLGQNGGSTRPTPGNPDGGGGIIPPTPDFPNGGGDTGGGSTPPTGGVCDTSTVLKPIKRLLAGASDGGIYYSEDNGNRWSPSIQPNGTKDYLWRTFADLGNDIVLAGSGDKREGDIRLGKGILRSTDGGKTWVTTNIASDQWNDLFYLGDGIVLVGSGSFRGVWRSTDYGITWEQNKQTDSAEAASCRSPDGIGKGDVSGFAILNSGLLITGRSYTSGGAPYPISISRDKGLTWCKEVLRSPKADFINQALVLMDGTLILATQWDKDMLIVIDRAGLPTSPTYLQPSGFLLPSDFFGEYNFFSLAQLRNGVVLAGGGKANMASPSDLKHSGIWRSLNNASLGSFKVSKMYKYQWRSIVGLDNCGAIASCYPVTPDPKKKEFICESSLYKSIDSGYEWKPMNNFPHYIFKLAIVR